MLSDIQAIVIATQSSDVAIPKLTEKICGQELIIYPLKTAHTLSLTTTILIQNHQTVLQKIISQHALFSTTPIIYNETPPLFVTQQKWQHPFVLIMDATMPFITPESIKELYATHITYNAAITFIAAHHEEPTLKYQRVIKKKQRIYLKNQHELSAKDMQEHCCISGGIYLISRDFLKKYAKEIAKAQTFADLVNLATNAQEMVAMIFAPFDQIRTVDSYQGLWEVEHIQRAQLIRSWMDRGIRFFAPHTVHLDLDVQIGIGSSIGNSVHLLSGSTIGTDTLIDAFSIIDHATIGNNSTIHPHSMVKNSTIGDHTQIGPFAHIQSDTIVGDHCALGNFVETKRTKLGNHSKAKHLTYLGDAQIGTHVNIGAGTITCNYDGKNKHTTTIEDHVFIGSNNSLVAPVTIKKEAFTAAGSVITHDVPSHALAFGRARQVNKEGYTHTIEHKNTQEEEYDDTKKSLSFIGAIKSSNIDL